MRSYVRIVPLLILALVLAVGGCAKRQVTGAPGSMDGSGDMAKDADGKGAGAGGPEAINDRIASRSMTEVPPEEVTEQAVFKDIHFDYDKSDIKGEDRTTLDAIADWLLRNRQSALIIEGHCDERGSSEYNLALGDRRAKAALGYLTAQGVSADRITTISYGEERPVAQGHDEDSWWQNRRAHFLVR